MRRPSHVVARHRGRNKEDLCHCTSRAQKPSDFSHSTLRCLPRRPKSGIFRHTFESTKWPNGPFRPVRATSHLLRIEKSHVSSHFRRLVHVGIQELGILCQLRQICLDLEALRGKKARALPIGSSVCSPTWLKSGRGTSRTCRQGDIRELLTQTRAELDHLHVEHVVEEASILPFGLQNAFSETIYSDF